MLVATVSLLAAAVARLPTALAAAGPPFYFRVVDLLILTAVLDPYHYPTQGASGVCLGWPGNPGLTGHPARAQRNERVADRGSVADLAVKI